MELIVSDLLLGHTSKRNNDNYGWTNTVDYTFLPQSTCSFGIFGCYQNLSAKAYFFYFKKSQYGSNSPHMSLIKMADRCASSSTNRITPSPVCWASQSLYEPIAVSLFARLPPRALLAASPLARDSCSATFPPRIFEQKRDLCSQSKFEANTCNRHQARENACEQARINFSFASHWLRKWREFY